MKLFKTFAAVACSLLMLSACNKTAEIEHQPYNDGIHIVPQPVSVETTGEGRLMLDKKTTIVVPNDSVHRMAEFFQDKLKGSTGFGFEIKDDANAAGAKNAITLKLVGTDVVKESEGYTLDVTAENGVLIQGSTVRGLFYGMQTLLQLLPAEVESSKVVRNVEWSVPFVSIKDYPRFAYRGTHLDPCRHFIPVENVKKFIDIMSMLKINIFHWHLTDDQGWRIEIKKYPELTTVGATRTEGDGSTYGPFFYTQEEVKEIVAYAQERQVEIIPEIECPGHAQAVLAAYPQYGCNPDFNYEVRNVWGIADDVYCAGNDDVFAFIEDVIDEVAPLFPSQYFHIGGDECPKVRWKTCPKCQQRMRNEKLKNEEELQSYFIHRVEPMVLKHGKKMIGWEEILQGGLAPSAVVMSWTGEDGGITSANMGHDVIMAPAWRGMYIDYFQGDQRIEPIGICCYVPLEMSYSYNPMPEKITEDKRHHVLGVQANLWAEYIKTPEHFEYMAYPRTFALAEIAWTPVEKKNYEDFLRRIDNMFVRLDGHDMNYYIPQPEQPDGSFDNIVFTDASTQVSFKSTFPVKMVYTLDGTEPVATSTEYTGPITITETTTLKIRSVAAGGKMSDVRTIEVKKADNLTASAATKESDGFAQTYKAGLIKSHVPGKEFKSSNDLVNYTGDDMVKTVYTKELKQDTYAMENPDRSFNYFGTMFDGYLYIPEDGVYVFGTTGNILWVNGEELINMDKEIHKYPRKDAALALKAGLHKIKLTFLGDNVDGWPSQWGSPEIYIRKYEDGTKFESVNPANFYHTADMQNK